MDSQPGPQVPPYDPLTLSLVSSRRQVDKHIRHMKWVLSKTKPPARVTDKECQRTWELWLSWWAGAASRSQTGGGPWRRTLLERRKEWPEQTFAGGIKAGGPGNTQEPGLPISGATFGKRRTTGGQKSTSNTAGYMGPWQGAEISHRREMQEKCPQGWNAGKQLEISV